MTNQDNARKIQELMSLCMAIQSQRQGEDGYPYVHFETTNYGTEVSIDIMDNGFEQGHGYDGSYDFEFDFISERTYSNCKRHLEDLVKKVSECTDTSVLIVGII